MSANADPEVRDDANRRPIDLAKDKLAAPCEFDDVLALEKIVHFLEVRSVVDIFTNSHGHTTNQARMRDPTYQPRHPREYKFTATVLNVPNGSEEGFSDVSSMASANFVDDDEIHVRKDNSAQLSIDNLLCFLILGWRPSLG